MLTAKSEAGIDFAASVRARVRQFVCAGKN